MPIDLKYIEPHNYIARVEQAVRDALVGWAQVIGLVEVEMTKREGYWERIYIVAWAKTARKDQPNTDGLTYGTHRVCIDSKGDSMCVIGHYDMMRNDAIADMIQRSGRDLVR